MVTPGASSLFIREERERLCPEYLHRLVSCIVNTWRIKVGPSEHGSLLFLCALCLWFEFSVTKTKTKTKDKERERKQLLKNSFACIVLCFPFKGIKKMIRCTVTSQIVQPDTLYRVDSTIRGRCVRICAVVNVCMPSKSTNQVVTNKQKKGSNKGRLRVWRGPTITIPCFFSSPSWRLQVSLSCVWIGDQQNGRCQEEDMGDKKKWCPRCMGVWCITKLHVPRPRVVRDKKAIPLSCETKAKGHIDVQDHPQNKCI